MSKNTTNNDLTLESADEFESESDSEPKTPNTKGRQRGLVGQRDSAYDNDEDERSCNPGRPVKSYKIDSKTAANCDTYEDDPIDDGPTRSSKNPFNDDDDDGAYMGRIRPIGSNGRPTRHR